MRFSHVVKVIIIFGAGLAVGLLFSSFLYQGEFSYLRSQPETPSLQEQQEKIYVSLMLDFQDGTVVTCNDQELVEKKTAFDLLKICSKDIGNPFELEYDIHSEWGVFIKRIGDKENGESEKYWQYWVNNEHAQVGAGQYQLKNRDVVEGKFIVSEFE